MKRKSNHWLCVAAGVAAWIVSAAWLEAQTVPVSQLTPEQVLQVSAKIITDAATGQDAALRSNAIEAAEPIPGMLLPLVELGLVDTNPAVRYAAVVLAGLKKFQQVIPRINPLVNDANPSVKMAALYALYRMGQPVNLTPMAEMLSQEDPRLRGNAAVLLGLLGDASAVPMLRQVAHAELVKASSLQAAVVRIQCAEAMARLGDAEAIDSLRAGMYSQYADVRVISVNALGAVSDRRMEGALINLLRDPGTELPPEAPEDVRRQTQASGKAIRLAAAGALARLGNEKGLDTVIELTADADPLVRAQTAWVLGWFKDGRTDLHLRRYLADPVPQVRVAAAAACLKRSVAEKP